MPERYNFISESIGDYDKVREICAGLHEFCDIIHVHNFRTYNGKLFYFITGQAIEEDSNLGPFELTTVFKEANVAAAWINDPTETGTINCKP